MAQYHFALPQIGLNDAVDGGPHATPVGYCTLITVDGAPVRRMVRLHEQITGRLVREMWSNASTGAWQFVGLKQGTYFVIAFDHTGAYAGVCETDIVLPAP